MAELGLLPTIAAQQKTPFRRRQGFAPTTSWVHKKAASGLSQGGPSAHQLPEFD
jgi:hypothetical protein